MSLSINVDHKTIRALMYGDPEFEVKVKDAILRTALKENASSVVRGLNKDYINRALRDALKEEVGQSSLDRNGHAMFELTRQMKEAIDDHISCQITSLIRTQFEKATSEANDKIDIYVNDFKNRIDRVLDDKFNKGLAEYVLKELTLRFTTLAEKLKPLMPWTNDNQKETK